MYDGDLTQNDAADLAKAGKLVTRRGELDKLMAATGSGCVTADYSWIVPRAMELFDVAVTVGWDAENGGLLYVFGPDREIVDSDKYYWVQAESFAAA